MLFRLHDPVNKSTNLPSYRKEGTKMEHSQSVTFSQLTQDHIARLKDAFQMIDGNGDGEISQQDLSKIHQNIGKSISEDELKKMLGKTEESTSATISFPEFLAIMCETMGEFPEEAELIRCLKTLSNNEESELEVSMNELISHLKDAGFENAEQEFEKVFKTFSANQQTTGDKIFKGKQFLDTVMD